MAWKVWKACPSKKCRRYQSMGNWQEVRPPTGWLSRPFHGNLHSIESLEIMTSPHIKHSSWSYQDDHISHVPWCSKSKTMTLASHSHVLSMTKELADNGGGIFLVEYLRKVRRELHRKSKTASMIFAVVEDLHTDSVVLWLGAACPLCKIHRLYDLLSNNIRLVGANTS